MFDDAKHSAGLEDAPNLGGQLVPHVVHSDMVIDAHGGHQIEFATSIREALGVLLHADVEIGGSGEHFGANGAARDSVEGILAEAKQFALAAADIQQSRVFRAD